MTASDAAQLSVAIVGNSGGTNVAESFRRAAAAMGHPSQFFDAYDAAQGPRVFRSLVWRFGGRRPLRLEEFSQKVAAACGSNPPAVLIATGAAPLTEQALRALRATGIVCLNYSTDDPWSQNHRAVWHLRALPFYDIVFTTRQSNIGDFRCLGCADVRYLPFGYDDALFVGPPNGHVGSLAHDVLFVGGADRDRVEFLTAFMRKGMRVSLVGGYWARFRATRPYTLGHKSPAELCALTAAAKVNLCLVRRANRDGHVMRSFEIAAIGSCMLVEDTEEHRALFGADGEAVRYFRSAGEAAEQARILIEDSSERRRLATAVRRRIVEGGHTYKHRLASMLESAAFKLKQTQA